MPVVQVPICLVSPLFLVFRLLSSPQISEEIVNRHSPLTGRWTCGATPRLIKSEIVEMIREAAIQAESLPPLPGGVPATTKVLRLSDR